MDSTTELIFVHPNDQKAVYGDTIEYTACEPPFWMAEAAAFCRNKRGDCLEIIDAEAENLSPDAVAQRVKRKFPKLVGIFVTGTNLSASTQKMRGADMTATAIKKEMPEVKLFYWGLHPSALPERTLLESDVDYVIKGESFDTIVRLLDEDTDYGNLPGLYYKDGDIVKKGAELQLLPTGELPMPAWDMLDMNLYMPHNWHIMGEKEPKDAKGRYGVISTNIGCPFNCSFCAISAQFGTKKVRQWDIDRVLSEIDRLVREYNVKYIKILDECFVLNLPYVNEFCIKLADRGYNLNIWCYARVNTVNPEILSELRKAGVQWLAYGIESADYNTLKAVDKGQYTSDVTRKAIQWTKDAGINTIANFMFGLPDDTKETMNATLDLCREINPEWINFSATMLYPGSKDYYYAMERGLIKNDKWIEYAQYSYECKPAGGRYLTPKEVLEFRDYAFNAFFKDNEAYFQNIREKFGEQYVENIKSMTKSKLRRKLLEDDSI